MPIPRAIARFNRYVTNPIARSMAGWAPGFAIIYHQGRRTGKTYNIPINTFKTDSGFMFALTYGSDTDWVRNVLATNRARIKYRSRMIKLVAPQLVATGRGMAAMPALVRVILRLLNVTEFMEMKALGEEPEDPVGSDR